MRLSRRSSLFALISSLVACTLGDPNDWVNVEYVISQAKSRSSGGSATADAQANIIRGADTSARKGPWSVVNSRDVLPPSGDPHDLLSWAPYHWPNCDWCDPSGRTHLAHTVVGSSSNSSDSSNGSSVSGDAQSLLFLSPPALPTQPREESTSLHRALSLSIGRAAVSVQLEVIAYLPTPLPTSIAPVNPAIPSAPSSTSTEASDGRTPGPAQAAAKTTKSPCTPSPTKSLAPSATWTTCPYVGRDGQVNPDVRTLNGPDALNSVSQAVIYNAVAYALQKSSTYSKNAANFVETFFLTPSTKMNPNMKFGQVVRGPGPSGQSGTFTGILDLRGLVKIVNGISILKAAGSPDWTKTQDDAMASWLSDYSTWLISSDIGRMTASRPNNHGTFYVSQVAAAKLLLGDRQGAITNLKNFCSTFFLDQVAKSGEQPFEAVRTRPFHYRCFNLEALITNAKLGDQLGIDLWTCKSRYGATIQTALDFLMSTNPGGEDATQLYPHVASVSAAYGDPQGRYAAFLKSKEPTYQSNPYWFYDQAVGFPNAPSSKKNARSTIWKREDPLTVRGNPLDPSAVPNVPFACPTVFKDVFAVEIEDSVYVTCDELRPFYEGSAGAGTQT